MRIQTAGSVPSSVVGDSNYRLSTFSGLLLGTTNATQTTKLTSKEHHLRFLDYYLEHVKININKTNFVHVGSSLFEFQNLMIMPLTAPGAEIKNVVQQISHNS